MNILKKKNWFIIYFFWMIKKRGRKYKDKLDYYETPVAPRRGSNRISDDISIEEIEKMFAEKVCEDNKRKIVDPLHYLGYVDDKTSINDIEQRFLLLESEQKKGRKSEDAARKVYLENASPNEILDIDAWLNADIVWENQQSDSEDNEFHINPNFEEDCIEDERILQYKEKKVAREKKIKISYFSDIYKLEKGPFLIERWLIRKLVRTNHIPAENLIQIYNSQKMENSLTISNHNFHINEGQLDMYYKLDYINGKTIRKIVKLDIGEVDGIVMDPPLGINDYTLDHLYELIKELKEIGPNPYIAIWVDPDTIQDIVLIAKKLNLNPCDSFVVELFDSMMEPIKFKTKKGFPQSTRMILVYRKYRDERSKILQQGIMDTGWGVVYPNGKSAGRYGMPLIPNTILETLLSKKKDKKFIELWPNRFSLAQNWYSFDEI